MRRAVLPLLLALLPALLPAPRGLQAQVPGGAPACWVRGDPADLELRASPYDSAAITLDAGTIKVCYSRPRKLGRPIMGRLVPYGEPWRFGANEATAIHVPTAATIAGVPVDSGWYALYVVPGEEEWGVVINGEPRRWGIPIDEGIREADLGAGTVPVERTDSVVELLTFRLQRAAPRAAELRVAWDRTAIGIPVVLGEPRGR